MNNYTRFGVMITTATAVMLGLMYLNTYQWDHIFFSETRAYMALIMGAVMAVVMLLFMRKMYTNKRVNAGIIIGSIMVFMLSLWLVRSQAIVTDVSYMRAMIPHHSIAILTSKNAQISDPRVRELADGIIRAQVKEIAEMKALIADLESKK
jgi:FlaA1/EpsC-like NDP-sugar epimerase